jgi:hypothetical protein
MPENNLVYIDCREYGELITAKATADALKALIRKKYENYSDILRTEIELLYVLYCEGGNTNG